MKHTKEMKKGIWIVLFLISTIAAYGIGLGTLEKEFVYRSDQISSIKWHITKESNQSAVFQVEYEGQLEDYLTLEIDTSPRAWYSSRANNLNVWLEREFDLTNVTTATMNFYTQYSIEYGWDFGYLEVSTNNGTNWTEVEGTSTINYNGHKVYTGKVDGWTYETVNLTPFTGNKIKFRFRYKTDYSAVDRGWLIDDIKISEINFYDDVDGGTNNWTTNGWEWTDTAGHDNSTVVPFWFHFQIPDSYTATEEVDRVKVTLLPYGESKSSFKTSGFVRVVANMPKIRKYIPPPQPSTGGGDTGGGPTSYYTYGTDRATYYKPIVEGGTVERVRPERRIDSPIVELELRPRLTARNVQVFIIPLGKKPIGIKQDPGTAYRYFNLETNNIEEKLEKGKIKFFVTSKWMEENEAKKEEIVLSRFNRGKWEDLDTRFTGMEGPNYLFEAETPGFSTFVIRKRGEVPEPIVIEPEPTEKPNITLEDITFVYNDTEQLEQLKEMIENKTGRPLEEKEENKTLEGESVEREPIEEPSGYDRIRDTIGGTMETIRGEESTVNYVEKEVLQMEPGTAGKIFLKTILTLSMIGLVFLIIILSVVLITIHEVKKTKEAKTGRQNKKRSWKKKKGDRE